MESAQLSARPTGIHQHRPDWSTSQEPELSAGGMKVGISHEKKGLSYLGTHGMGTSLGEKG